MSITIWIPTAPRKTVDCTICAMAGGRCWDGCDGTEEVSTAPELNWSNANAARVFALIGLGSDEWGELTPQEIPAVLQRINVAIARSAERALATERQEEPRIMRQIERPDGVTELRAGPRVIYCEQSADSWTRRLEGLRDLLSYAAQIGENVSWG